MCRRKGHYPAAHVPHGRDPGAPWFAPFVALIPVLLLLGGPEQRTCHGRVCVDLLVDTVHAIGARAERKVEGELLDDFKRVTGKQWLLSEVAAAALARPEGTVGEVVFPVVNEATLRDLVRDMGKLPDHVRRSLTWDRGMELANHRAVTAQTGLDVYFADPHGPWQRGTNENTNRLLRQYFPKGASMTALTQADLDGVAAKLNARPRKTLDFATPAARFEALLR